MINNHGKLEKDKIVELTDYVQQLCLEVKNEEKDLEGVSLFKIVEQFLTYIILLQPEQIDLDITANFLMSVSILILWKSNLLLPSNQEENTEDDFSHSGEDFWQEYRKYHSMIHVLEDKAERQSNIYLTYINKITENNDQDQQGHFTDLILAIESVLSKRKIKNGIQLKKSDYNIDKKMEEIENQLMKNNGKLSFHRLIAKNYSKIEVIILFLALLELICRGRINYRQSENFGDIIFYQKSNIVIEK